MPRPHRVGADEQRTGRADLAAQAFAETDLVAARRPRPHRLLSPEPGPGAMGSLDVPLALGILVVRIVRLTSEIADRAALLRARHASLRLPDALVLATGETLGADTVLTADRAWSRVSRRAQVI